MRSPRLLAVTGLLVATAVLAAGCGSGAATQPAATGTPPSQGQGGFPKTITHDKGTTVLPAKPRRVVALDPSLVAAVLVVDGPLVGGIPNYTGRTGPSYLGDAVKGVTDVGPLTSPNLEAIAALQPDVIVSATVRHDALYDELSKIAPTVFVKTTGPQWQENITTIGDVLGAEDKAAKTLSDYRQRAAAVGAAVNAKANQPTISVVNFRNGPTRLYRKASFSGKILQDMGLARPPSQDVADFAAEIGEEQIRQADADVVFVASSTGGQNAQERFRRNPLWGQLKAVQNDRVYDVSAEVWIESVSLQGAAQVIDDIARVFGVDPART